MLKKWKKKKRLMAGLTLSTFLLGSAGVYAAQDGAFGSNLVGRLADGSVQTPVNQLITPAGKQIEFNGNPMSVTIHPNGKTAMVLNGKGQLNMIDLTTGKQIGSSISLGLSHTWGLAYSKDGSHLYATGSGSTGQVVSMSIADDGTPTVQNKFTLPAAKVGGNINPLDLAVGPEGQLLVALNRDNSLGVVDSATGALTARIPVGNAPTSVLVDGNTAYVTNQGGRVAQSGDTTNISSGTSVVSDPKNGASSTGAVSVVDLATNTVTKTIDVGVQPERMTQSGQYLFVTNTNSDTISVIDTKTNEVAQTIDIHPYPDSPKGSAPNAVKMLDGNKLLVSLSRDNAVAVYDWNGPTEVPELKGLIPTAWFPVDLAIDSASQRILVANSDGVGSLGPASKLTIQGITTEGHSSYSQVGSLSMIPFPSTEDLVQGTKQVYTNNDWFGMKNRNAKARENKKPVAMPERIGEPSTIKHVFYIVKENRTYDQVLGDIGKGNSEPALVQFPEKVTPNFHKLAKQFPLLDNTYVGGIQSASGHQWIVQGTNPDYQDKETNTGNVRSYPYNGGDAMTYASTGFIWDNAIKNRISYANFGEYTNQFKGTMSHGSWTDWYNDYLKKSGQQQGDLRAPIGSFQATSDVPSLNSNTYHPFPGFDTSIPDQYRTQLFLDQFQQYVKNNNLPQLVTMTLPDDHTSGTSTGTPTPQAQVADNDLAVGKIVDAISHSPYWKDSVIFITEDDSQNGLDHVDGHREPAYVISPWVKRGITNSHYWTVVNMTRSIEQILGMQPMNQTDAAAEPMSELFTDEPDFTPYDVEQNQISLTTLNGTPEANTAALANTVQVTPEAQELSKKWTEWSNKNNDKFSGENASPDQVNPNMMNHAVWYATKGFDKPYPGEKKVHTPDEVEKQPESNALSTDGN